MKKDHLANALDRMKEADIRSIDTKDLVDIDTVKIQKELPVEERLKDYLRQIKNPYCYLSHGVVVKISFAGTRTLEECLESCIAMES